MHGLKGLGHDLDGRQDETVIFSLYPTTYSLFVSKHRILGRLVSRQVAFQLFGSLSILITVRLLERRPRQSKVANLDVAIPVYEQVGWLHVAVHDPCGMNKVQAAEYIVQDEFDMILIKLSFILVAQQLLQVGVDILHHDEDVRHWCCIFQVEFGHDDIQDLGSETVIFDGGQLAQDLNLTDQLL